MRILVVEDEPAAARVLAQGLREHAYAVDVAADGVAALERAEATDYDLVLLDVLLPRIDGLALCRKLRGSGAAMPILMLTARGGLDERVQGLDAGADDYLSKPYHFPELLARIRALLRRGPAITQDTLSIGDLVVDVRGRRATRAGQRLQLTTKEFALLEYLMRRRDAVVTRSEIADHVWDGSFDGMSNLIDVYIQRLRRKIDDAHDVKLIQTRRGAGYAITLDDAGTADV
ncbi:MAG TPA: response regulator transcription factor [Vicinamibacterales bacterium]|nr:response regulator transcription factor [Vicinamibacterales bacterium]